MKYENFSNVFSIVTASVGVSMIYDVIGIIILILSGLNILINMCFKIYDKIKEKKYKEISNVIDDSINELEDLKEEDK